jgi:hypothetical protein
MISVTPTPLEVESKRKSRFNLAKTRARTRHHGELSIIRATCMMLCRDVRSRKSASGLPRAMSSTSPSSSRISQHLSRFVYEPGVRSPRKPGGPSRAGNVQTTTPEKAAGSVPHTPSPKIKKSPGSTPATTRSKSSSGKRSYPGHGTDHDVGDSTLDSIDASDMSDSTQRSSKRRRLESPKEKPKKIPRGYAAPEVYAHLDMLPDRLREGLDGESVLGWLLAFGTRLKLSTNPACNIVVIFSGIK